MPIPKDPEKYAAYVEHQRRGSSGRRHTPEAKAKISAAMKGRTKTPEHRAKLSAARLGRKQSPEAVAKTRAALTGLKRSPETKARIAAARRGKPRPDVTARQLGDWIDEPGYGGLHRRLARVRGTASQHSCERCDKPAQEWALRKGCGQVYPPQPHAYSLDINDYFPLCASCHKKYDEVNVKRSSAP